MEHFRLFCEWHQWNMVTLLEIIEAYKPYPKPNERAIPSTIIKNIQNMTKYTQRLRVWYISQALPGILWTDES